MDNSGITGKTVQRCHGAALTQEKPRPAARGLFAESPEPSGLNRCHLKAQQTSLLWGYGYPKASWINVTSTNAESPGNR